MVMYMLILFVSLAAVTTPDGQPSWRFLGDYGETAIVRAAEGFMPAVRCGDHRFRRTPLHDVGVERDGHGVFAGGLLHGT